MQTPKSNLDALMKTPQGAVIAKHKDEIMGLMQSSDAQKLMEMLNKSAGGGLKGAADAAMKGDTSQLMDLMGRVMSSKEGAEVVGRINKAVPKDANQK
ncbi:MULTISPECIES: hypothetical protein [Oscillospiraceae]|uniref:Uncharacterized protein n=1 Tax=Lawsonibacter faecis TaxID=2763052 RepID=A0A8J6JGZ0_9FIRM|nr:MULTISPECIES: hypothetical protein [Oscillospiraceae]MTQ97223.1 hypothetical protein [Pseudoflavonifractor sp. BIOML-A16]MTR05261.1 hypothetical protein [Pseudoflavonifractor sp. BIOML-A15]MTR31528.1 hypothetical protein [Pseudoflavonifractor sp. BIOML-A14]MTR72214.1 hypothetical protein [Pseudoflavonifractor sp. BIOML-A18]MTS63046.1 hypothetical protein [Pseudoflavonifractor sp. BIOML-A5]MTS70616.1 hypothetical protein [Pseudoflavonifractor sp. BIOML-A8]MTS91334.1 hypothetical protein [P